MRPIQRSDSKRDSFARGANSMSMCWASTWFAHAAAGHVPARCSTSGSLTSKLTSTEMLPAFQILIAQHDSDVGGNTSVMSSQNSTLLAGTQLLHCHDYLQFHPGDKPSLN